MYYLAASGICLAALFGSTWYEYRRMKKEEIEIKTALTRLREIP